MILLLDRSQDKGFHVEKALVHVFTRSLPYTPVHLLKVEEVVEGEKVQYEIPAELGDYVSRYSNIGALQMFEPPTQTHTNILTVSCLSSGDFSAQILPTLSN